MIRPYAAAFLILYLALKLANAGTAVTADLSPFAFRPLSEALTCAIELTVLWTLSRNAAPAPAHLAAVRPAAPDQHFEQGRFACPDAAYRGLPRWRAGGSCFSRIANGCRAAGASAKC